MKNRFIIYILLFTATLFASCIREEAPNAECDIVSVDTTYTWFRNNKDILTGKFAVNNDNINFIIKKEVDFKTIEIEHDSITPAFILTPGARIEKHSSKETVRDNSGISLYYTVYAEDGVWKKDYEIKFMKVPPLGMNQTFSFENSETGTFYSWHEIYKGGIRSDIWSSGNAGFKMCGMAKTPDDFPTISYSEGYSGDCVKLTTCDTGTFGKMAGMPIAAGSLFIGEFDVSNAMKKPLEATRFGLQIAPSKPVALTGHYRYTPGDIFTDKKKAVVENRRDTCSIYAVLFEVDPDNMVQLDGSNISTSDRIVLFADLENPGEPAEWTEFTIPFEPRNGKTFSYEKLANNEYAITVVASSSKYGAFFEGAVGSTLLVDELKIEWEEK